MSPRARRIDARMHGVLLVDKPAAHTSHDVVARVRRAAGFVRCGHAGTLDPMATGVLPVLLGDATRLSDCLMNHDKVYAFTLRFGQTTDTQDAEGRVLEERPVPELSRDRVLELLAAFTGPQRQVVPMYSAVKVDGRPLHRAARRGQEVERPERDIVVHSLELVSWESPDLAAVVACTKGTYVRQLAHDLGLAAGCGAHVTALRRLRSGPFDVARALPLPDILALDEDRLAAALIPLREALAGWPSVRVTLEQEPALRNGQELPAADGQPADEGRAVVLVDAGGRALALAERHGDRWRPTRVFPGSFEKTTCISASFHQNPVTGG